MAVKVNLGRGLGTRTTCSVSEFCLPVVLSKLCTEVQEVKLAWKTSADVKVTGYSSGRGPRSKRAMSCSAQSQVQKTEHKQRGTSCVYTARRNRLPCTSNVLWTVEFWKLLNQNLTIQSN